MHWLWFHLGLSSGNGAWYLFPSGWGSIVLPPLLNGVVIAAVFWWHHQCHVTGCYWYARRTTAAGERACRRHHPDGKVTVADLRSRHHLYLGKQPGRG